MNVIFQGHVAIDGSTKITCTTDSLIINTMIINNATNDYTITVNRTSTGPGIHQVPLYTLELNSGDTVRDIENYILNKGNYIQIISDVAGTTYYINATQE